MKQAISGVSPPQVSEVTVMNVWPSIAAYPSGRFLGRLYAIRWPDVYIFRLGNLLALASIPHALALYFYRLMPSFFGAGLHGAMYSLTNRRIRVIRSEINTTNRFPFVRFIFQSEVKSVDLDRFDTITIEILPGQEWFHAGDLVFRLGNVETFRLEGVSRPEAFRQTCAKARQAYVGVKRVMDRQPAMV